MLEGWGKRLLGGIAAADDESEKEREWDTKYALVAMAADLQGMARR